MNHIFALSIGFNIMKGYVSVRQRCSVAWQNIRFIKTKIGYACLICQWQMQLFIIKEKPFDFEFIFYCRKQGHFTIIPVLVGSLSAEKEDTYGKIFAKYLADPENLFVISSDFCHWGEWSFLNFSWKINLYLSLLTDYNTCYYFLFYPINYDQGFAPTSLSIIRFYYLIV